MDFEFVKNFVDEIVCRYGTSDVLTIAEKAGVRIIYEKWFPVTVGEFDKRAQTICVNLSADEQREKIVAHELGHFFAVDLNLSKTEEENFAHLFAAELIKNNG